MAYAGIKSSPQVVIVEDDRIFLSFWRRFMETIGISDYILMTDPLKARDLIMMGGCRLLISDINMKGLNGYQLAKITCEHDPRCAIILTTAYGANLSHFDLANCTFHLLYKPYNNLDELAKLIKHLLAGDKRFDDISEDSFSENEDFPTVTEWKL